MTKDLCSRLSAGETCLNGWLMIPAAFVVEVLAQAGWHSLTIDMQHGLHDERSMLGILQAAEASPCSILVRLASNDATAIGRALDMGAHGLICPLVNSRADAERFIAASRYPPQGLRSHGPVRAALYAPRGEALESVNRRVFLLAQIETVDAVDRLEEILDTPDLSGIYVGPSDLGISLGLGAGFDREEPRILEILGKIAEACRARGAVAGIHCQSANYAMRMAQLGYGFLTIGSDLGFMFGGAVASLDEFRRGVGSAIA